ncbi:hypothetical protein ACC691_40370, partial [Rhizobium johnstonii]|uniref:hypothetical protein n=1 Tax=Rhizobium johnstonii TaxID=3019933 RepID=UPI003F9B811E
LEQLLALIGVQQQQLDAAYPPRLAFAGNPHPVVVIEDGDVFDSFTFAPVAARSLLDALGWPATITVLHVIGPTEFEARNIFP